MNDKAPRQLQRMHGNEPIVGTTLTLVNFWQWLASNLLGTVNRSALAEFLVASDLDLSGEIRREWKSCDLTTKSGIRIEVKSAAYLQDWTKDGLSKIVFRIAKTRRWDPDIGGPMSTEASRNADVYVFCILNNQDGATNPLDTSKWEFYVLPTATLDAELGNQKTLELGGLKRLNPIQAKFGEIQKAVAAIEQAKSNIAVSGADKS